MMRDSRIYALAATLAGLIALTTLGGCGFKLRGQDTASLASHAPIQLVGLAFHDPLHRSLSMVLKNAGAQLSSSAASASGVVRLSVRDHKSTRRILAVDGSNNTVEFELEESFLFSLRNAQGVDTIPERRLRTLRISLNPETEVLGRAREEQWLRRDMREELARRVVDQISAVR